MKQHRDISIRVAEIVMGWDVIEEEVDGSIHRTYATPSGHIKQDDDIPDYANDIALAWHVVANMIGNSWKMELLFQETEEAPTAYATFTCTLGERPPGEAAAATPSLAICLAALEAVEGGGVIDA